uniref:Innexin n=1 Tax=Rhabditophanes sp. KR3021 TaxID=114890 RepID=A0AC35U2L6_9BILA
MAGQIGAISSVNGLISKAFQQPKGDLADRLNSRYTVGLLALGSGLLLTNHFWGEPITCWTPAQFTKTWSDFVNHYCYLHGTYFVPLEEQLSFDEDERRKVPINYYQWVPYVLALQALMYSFPRFIWKIIASFSGFDLTGSVRYVDRFWHEIRDQNLSFNKRVNFFREKAGVYIWDGIRLGRTRHGHNIGYYYLAFSFFQTLNAWFQFILLNSLLQSTTYNFWGPSILTDLLSGSDWQETGHFPRITHCDFSRRRPASIQLDTVLCVLTLNIYYEKLMLFLWFWMLFVAVYSTYSCIAWFISMCITSRARAEISGYLKTHNSPGNKEKFFSRLGPDGIFILQHIAVNIGHLPTSYLTIAMQNIVEEWDDAVGYDGELFIKS